MRILILAALAVSPALADCPGEVIFSCKIKAKTLELCLTADTLRYTFGKAEPELSITANLAEVPYTPWPGIGRTIWDSVLFENEGINYEVWNSIDKMMDEDDPPAVWQGGVIVTRGDETLSNLACTTPPDPPSIDLLYEAKETIGQCWDFDAKVWTGCN